MEEVRDVIAWAKDSKQNKYDSRLALFLMYTGARIQEVDPFVVESLLGHALQGSMSHYVLSKK